MAEVVHYLCVARLSGRDWYFLWESEGDTPDRVVINGDGSVLTFASEQAARDANAAISPEEAAVYNLDDIDAWCRSAEEVGDCSALLKVWNLLGDLPRAENVFGEADARATNIYDKLFWGCNLPSMTPPGERYLPTWSASETASLKRLLLLGLAEFRGRLR